MGKYDKRDPEEAAAPDEEGAAALIGGARVRTIDGVKYRCEPFGSLDMIDMQPKIAAVMGEAGGLAGDSLFGGYGDTADMVQAGKAIDVLAQKFVEVGGSDFIVDMCKRVSRIEDNGEATPMTRAQLNNMRAKTLHIYKLVLFAIEVNHADFLDTGRDGAAGLKTNLFDLLSTALTRVTQQLAESGSG